MSESSDGFSLGPAEVKSVTLSSSQNSSTDTEAGYPPILAPVATYENGISIPNNSSDNNQMMIVIILCAALGAAGIVGAGIFVYMRRRNSVPLMEADMSQGVSHARLQAKQAAWEGI
mmetsp:Transcript_37123/g.71220  ORF Transcript_37123/g.71220 Transcript_37123/m.71220 type:complete len:117 (+) Transcript_37123:1644-1994(+)